MNFLKYSFTTASTSHQGAMKVHVIHLLHQRRVLRGPDVPSLYRQ